MIHSRDNDVHLWRTLCERSFGHLASSSTTTEAEEEVNWKHLYRMSTMLKFDPKNTTPIGYITDDDGTEYSNHGRTLTTHSVRWMTIALNKMITIADNQNRSKFCFQIILDKFIPEEDPLNYYSVVVGVIFSETNVPSVANSYPISGYTGTRDPGVGFYCGNRIIHKSGIQYHTDKSAASDMEFSDHLLKSGDVVTTEISFEKGMFDIDFYVNGIHEDLAHNVDQNILKNIRAKYIIPCISIVNSHSVSVRYCMSQ
jgi:hypothetical protein